MSTRVKTTYRDAGVDRTTHGRITQALRVRLKSTDPRVLNRVGAFASLFEASFPGVLDPVLVLKVEEPGSKQYLASKYGMIKGIGFDLVNHLINDIIAMGARPLAVMDVIVAGKIDKKVVLTIIESMNQACQEQDCTLVGGETSEQPGVLPSGVFVLSSSALGVVSRSKIIDGSRIKEEDRLIALSSNGLMTNGYALVRKLMADNPRIIDERVAQESFLDAIMKPHPAYYPFLKDILGSEDIHGLAHITGDGIAGNLERVLPVRLGATVFLDRIRVLPIFRFIREKGNVPPRDLLANLNLGVGMVMVVSSTVSKEMTERLRGLGLESYEIGVIDKDELSRVKFSGRINWS